MANYYRYNNAGNIRLIKASDAPFSGEVRPPVNPAWREFRSEAYGFRAMFKLLQNYISLYGWNTIEKIMAHYAPKSPNTKDDPVGYAKHVSEETGISKTKVLSPTNKSDLVKIVKAMARIESGKPTTQEHYDNILKGWDLLGTQSPPSDTKPTETYQPSNEPETTSKPIYQKPLFWVGIFAVGLGLDYALKPKTKRA